MACLLVMLVVDAAGIPLLALDHGSVALAPVMFHHGGVHTQRLSGVLVRLVEGSREVVDVVFHGKASIGLPVVGGFMNRCRSGTGEVEAGRFVYRC